MEYILRSPLAIKRNGKKTNKYTFIYIFVTYLYELLMYLTVPFVNYVLLFATQIRLYTRKQDGINKI